MYKEMRWSLLVGREAWKETESRNSRDVLGPAVFSGERGTPSWRKADFRVERPCNGGEEGGVTVRKSSRR